MNLSNSGSIIIIDDNYEEEAKPLLEVFSMNNCPYLFFDGSFENLPSEPLKGIRFIFLDIELKGLEGQPPKTKASGVIARLEKLISIENGPYVLIAWAKHSDDSLALIKNACSDKNISPVLSIDMEKTTCLREIKKQGLNFLEDHIQKKLNKLEAFQLYVDWENIIGESSISFIYNMASLFPSDDKWSTRTKYLFYKLYKAFVEENVSNDKDEQIRCTLSIMNKSLIDCIDNNIFMYKPNPDFKLSGGRIDKIIDSKINTNLFIIENPIIKKTPGSVYKTSYKIEGLLENSFQRSKFKDNDFISIYIIITPACDIARPKKFYRHRILYGIMYESTEKYIPLKNEFIYHAGPIFFNNKSNELVFNMQTISSVSENEIIDEDRIFAFRFDWFYDIQTKTANNLNRLGKFELR